MREVARGALLLPLLGAVLGSTPNCRDRMKAAASAASAPAATPADRGRRSTGVAELDDASFMMSRLPGTLASLKLDQLPQWKENNFVRDRDLYLIHGRSSLIVYEPRGHRILRVSDRRKAECATSLVVVGRSLYAVCRRPGAPFEVFEIDLDTYVLKRSYKVAQGTRLASEPTMIPIGTDLWVEGEPAFAKIATTTHTISLHSRDEAERRYAAGPPDPALFAPATNEILPVRVVLELSGVVGDRRYLLTSGAIDVIDASLAFPARLVALPVDPYVPSSLAWLIDGAARRAIVMNTVCSCHGGGTDLWLVDLAEAKVVGEHSFEPGKVMERVSGGQATLAYRDGQYQVRAPDGEYLLSCRPGDKSCALHDEANAKARTDELVSAVLDETLAPAVVRQRVSATRASLGVNLHELDLARALNTRGHRLYGKEALDEALPLFALAAELAPSYGMPRYNAARVLARKGDTAGCLEYLRELVQLGPGQHSRLLQARRDRGFERLWKDPAFLALFVR